MIIEYIRYKIRPEKKQAFLNGYQQAGEFLRLSPTASVMNLRNGMLHLH